MNLLSLKFDFGCRHFKTALGTQPCLCDVTPFNLKLAGSRKSLQLTWHASQRQQNVVFFLEVIIQFTIFTAIIVGVWSTFGSK